jgi:hypothetical protein
LTSGSGWERLPGHGATDEFGRTGVKSMLVANAALAIADATAVDPLAAGAAR